MLSSTMRWTWMRYVVLLPLFYSCSEECERSACEARREPARASIAQGIAGVVSYADDQVVNGCRECKYVEVSLAVFALEAAISVADAPEIIQRGEPSFFTADGRYEHALADGEYLLCEPFSRACVLVTVQPGGVTTVHVRLAQLPGFDVFEPGEEKARDDAGFSPDVPEEVWQRLLGADEGE